MAVVSLLPSAAPGQGNGIRHFIIRKIYPLLLPRISNNWGLFRGMSRSLTGRDTEGHSVHIDTPVQRQRHRPAMWSSK